MVLNNEQYLVTILTEITPSLDGYRVIYQADGIDMHDFYCARLIEVKASNGTVSRVTLLDNLISKNEPCAVLEDNVLTVPLFDTILQIDLETATLIRCVDCENWGGLEQIFEINQGYLFKGECDIFYYDKMLNQVWRFGGRDILARVTEEKCFWIENDLIHCRDWAGWHYVLDMDGNIISEFREDTTN